jgi:acyl-CoA synthetase (AMP-forming)/AMP-acid ligase II
VHAVIVRRVGSTVGGEEIQSFARDHLARYKIPRSFSFSEELPKTGSGKVLKRELRAPYWAGHDSKV